MSNRLIDNLRNASIHYGHEMYDLLNDSADKIEDLAVDNKNLRQDLKELAEHIWGLKIELEQLKSNEQ